MLTFWNKLGFVVVIVSAAGWFSNTNDILYFAAIVVGSALVVQEKF